MCENILAASGTQEYYAELFREKVKDGQYSGDDFFEYLQLYSMYQEWIEVKTLEELLTLKKQIFRLQNRWCFSYKYPCSVRFE